jgi:plastocyanin
MRHVRSFGVVLGAALFALVGGVGCDNKGKAASGAAPKPTADKPAPTGSGVIQGVVKLAGAQPAPEPWGGTSSSDCRTLHPETIQLVNVTDGKLADAFIYVKAGLPEGYHEAPAKALVVDQKGCEFTPRVFGLVAGQPIEFGNSDAFMHNVKSPEFNQGLATRGAKMQLKLNEEGVMVPIRCDVHPWMRAYAGVLSHPHFDVSKADGTYKITGLVDGQYTVAVWHEKLGPQEHPVKVAGATPATLDIELRPK